MNEEEICREARERMMRDMTGQDFHHHLIRTTYDFARLELVDKARAWDAIAAKNQITEALVNALGAALPALEAELEDAKGWDSDDDPDAVIRAEADLTRAIDAIAMATAR